jgi:hypothetical protein
MVKKKNIYKNVKKLIFLIYILKINHKDKYRLNIINKFDDIYL